MSPSPVPDDTADTDHDTDEITDTGAPAASDDVKRRFKEALDRKQGRHADGTAAGEGGDRAKVHGGAHGPAQQQRQFRRKSGG